MCIRERCAVASRISSALMKGGSYSLSTRPCIRAISQERGFGWVGASLGGWVFGPGPLLLLTYLGGSKGVA